MTLKLVLPWTSVASDNERNKARGGRAHSAAYKAARDAIHLHALDQIRGERPAFPEGPVEVRLRFYPPNWRPDCHDTLKVIFDSLQGTAYANDKQIRSISHLVVDTDHDNPRVEVTVMRWLSTEAA
jgi:Holliday junction resolvase RusA-like endonuclease